MGLAQGEARYDDQEKHLAVAPTISIPTITLEGDANGAPHPDSAVYAKKFTPSFSYNSLSLIPCNFTS